MPEDTNANILTVNGQWESFVDALGLKDAPLVQRREMKRAFFAGARVMLFLTATLSDAMDEDHAVVHLEMIDQELEDFKQEQMGWK